MADWQILSITGAVIVGIVLLIIKVRLNPVVALIIGALTLGVSTGMTPGETTDTVMTVLATSCTKLVCSLFGVCS